MMRPQYPMVFALAFVACACLLSPAVGEARQSTATIAGSVTSGDAERDPVRRVRITVNPDRGGNGWSTSTDDSGRFVVRGLPAGRYTVHASKPAWLTASYGAARPGRLGTPITLEEGQQVQNVSLRMQRGGVLTGTVRDRRGQPVPGVIVNALRYTYSPSTGERILGASGAAVQATTDDRGVFRAYGLVPGDYVVIATLRLTNGGPMALQNIRQLTDAEVQSAAADVRMSGSASMSSPGQPTVSYAPIYYPGTPDVSSALSIAVNAGEEHGGIDMTLDPVRTARIDGVLNIPPGLAAQTVQIFLIAAQPGRTTSSGMPSMANARIDANGKFTFGNVTPGAYTITARAAAPAEPSGVPSPSLALYATADVAVAGQDVGISLTLAPGMSVSGRLVFDGAAPPPAPSVLAGTRASLAPVASGPALTVQDAAIDATGRFAFAGVPAGRYRLSLSPPAGMGAWSMKSSMARGHETLDAPLDITPGDPVTDWTITFTDRPTRLSGTMQDATGRAAPDYFIIAFAQDRSFWTPQSRRIRQVRPGTDGTYAIIGLPPGGYFVAALTDVEPGEWYSPAFLEQLVPTSVRITLTDGDASTQDLKIAEPNPSQ